MLPPGRPRRAFVVRACTALLVAGFAQAQQPRPRVPVLQAARETDVFTPAPFDEQHLDGLFAARLRVNLEQRLLRVDEEGILAGFRSRPGRQAWIGEHAGKFLDAAANMWLYTGDDRLRELMDRVAKTLIACQQPGGYLGTYTEDRRWTSWDVWVHKYDLLGLIAYYRATGYRPALDAAARIGDLMCRTFGTARGQLDIIGAGEHVGMAATSILEPMVLLYQQTGEQRYLDFCLYIVHAWDEPGGPGIIASLSAGKGVFHTANGKAYEMMSNLVGLSRLYRVTGNPLYLQTIESAWRDIQSRRLYVSGTTSAHEHFQDDIVLPADQDADVGEGCATVTWLQLNSQLLRLTGEPRYAAEIERTVYNQLLAAQDPVNGNICYFTPLNGRKEATPGINCCVSSEPRGISLIPELAWGTENGGLAVNLYTQGEARFSIPGAKVQIVSRTTYPQSGIVQLSVNPDKPVRFPLLLRVPDWTRSFEVEVDGRKLTGLPGTYLSVERTWKAGDEVAIRMDMTIRLIPGGRSYPDSVAVARGPQLLAFEETLNRSIVDTQRAGPVSLRPEDLNLRDAGNGQTDSRTGNQAYRINGQVNGAPQPLVLVPFADARVYRVWMARPGRT